jgi:hypothetical protein
VAQCFIYHICIILKCNKLDKVQTGGKIKLCAFSFSFLDLGIWLTYEDHQLKTKRHALIFLYKILRKILGYSIRLFCFCCVALQSYVCFNKYLNQPVSTKMVIIPNIGTYPVAVTFCKMLNISDMTPDTIITNEKIADLVMIEALYFGSNTWSLVYQNASFSPDTVLTQRKFITNTWSKDKFQVCISLRLGTDTLLLQQLRFKFKWLDCRMAGVYRPPNLQVFLHGWGSFEKVTYKIPLAQVPQVFQLDQKTVLTLPSKGKDCSLYESGSLDECLEQSALWYANDIAGCIEKPQR